MGQDLVGLGVVAKLKEKGVAKVIAGDVSKKRCEASKELGADVVVDELNEDIVEVAIKETEGKGAAAVIVTSREPANFQQAIDVVQHDGMGT